MNTHPEKGHLHRRRSKTVKKAIDYIDVILIKNRLAGNHYMEKAVAVVKEENAILINNKIITHSKSWLQ